MRSLFQFVGFSHKKIKPKPPFEYSVSNGKDTVKAPTIKAMQTFFMRKMAQALYKPRRELFDLLQV